MAGDRLVAARNQHGGVVGHDGRMQFDHVGDHLSRGEDIVHAVMTLPPSIADVRHVMANRPPANLVNAKHGFVAQFLQMEASRMAFAKAIIDQDLWFFSIFNGVIHTQSERIELRPQISGKMTFLGHLFDFRLRFQTRGGNRPLIVALPR